MTPEDYSWLGDRLVLLVCIIALIVLLCPSAEAKYNRDPAVARQFQRENPCPSTGRRTGACPGYTKDRVRPLCKGGADAVWNLQWSTTAEAKAKDRWECK